MTKTRCYVSGKSISAISDAIAFMLYRHSSTDISRPHGFIIDCLKCGWSKGFNIFYEPELPKFQSVREINNFVERIFKPDKNLSQA